MGYSLPGHVAVEPGRPNGRKYCGQFGRAMTEAIVIFVVGGFLGRVRGEVKFFGGWTYGQEREVPVRKKLVEIKE